MGVQPQLAVNIKLEMAHLWQLPTKVDKGRGVTVSGEFGMNKVVPFERFTQYGVEESGGVGWHGRYLWRILFRYNTQYGVEESGGVGWWIVLMEDIVPLNPNTSKGDGTRLSTTPQTFLMHS